jgi:hypothetical protein
MIANFCTQIPIVLFMKFNVMIFTVILLKQIYIHLIQPI